MTKSNDQGENVIKNNYNNTKYEEFCKLNNFAAIFFLFIFHQFVWYNDVTPGTNISTN